MTRFYRLGLVGYPLGHSLSPRLHTRALREAGLAGEYELYPIPLEDTHGLASLLDRVRSGEIAGLNVTIPHKQAVLGMVDELTPLADRAGAVNTLYARDGLLVGDNTDVPGFRADLERFLGAGHAQAGAALVLGAGGAARAVVLALLDSGWQISLAARRIEQAQALAKCFPQPVKTLPLTTESMEHLLPPPGLIVNATPLGMHPHTGTSPWPEGLPFPPGAAVYDLIYNPPQTRLVRDAFRTSVRPARPAFP
ncbi:MAG TPA: shikimate dehydrogenase, partial [Anaerolineaceae bacterium]